MMVVYVVLNEGNDFPEIAGVFADEAVADALALKMAEAYGHDDTCLFPVTQHIVGNQEWAQ